MFLKSVSQKLIPQALDANVIVQDHIGGVPDLQLSYPSAKIIGGDARIPGAEVLQHNAKLKLGSSIVTALSTPCHTKGHMAFLVEGNEGTSALFSGDTLFVAGCGRFFELYCAHEYTRSNLQFAHYIEKDNGDIQEMLSKALETDITVRHSVIEKSMLSTRATDAEVLKALRSLKDQF